MGPKNISVLCLNAGSSSVKFQLFDAIDGGELKQRLRGQLEGIGERPHLVAKDEQGQTLFDETYSVQEVANVEAGLPKLTAILSQQLKGRLPDVVGHRVVSGGTRFAKPVLIDADTLNYLEGLVPLMPLHLPPELKPISALRRLHPDLPQVCIFDTSFHHGHDMLRQRLPIPKDLHEEGVLSYGYHGISYEFIAGRLREIDPELAKGRVVVAHLGSGSSMCGMVDGRSVEASWGFSALDGLIMGTRPGRLDPGILLYLLKAKGMSVDQVTHMLYHDCGLKGLSGISNDVRELLESGDPRAALAIEAYCHSCAGMIASLAIGIGGLDGLVFTAGIGEHAAPVRENILKRLACLGAEIDKTANSANEQLISSSQSTFTCYVIPTNEELMIARHAVKLIRSDARGYVKT